MHKRPQATSSTPGRNDPCPCGSGRKYKHCCAGKDRASALQNDFAVAHYRRGLALETRGQIDAAMEAYRVATASGSAPEAHSRLGHLLAGRGFVSEARLSFRAAGASVEDFSRRLDLVRALMIEGKTEEAEAEARSAVRLDPKSAYGFWLLGRIPAEAGRFIEARAALERSIALDPELGGAYYDLVRTGRISEADRALIDQMLKVVGTLGSQDQRVRLHLAIGKALDDLGEYGPAMQQFEIANRIKATLGSFDRDAFAHQVDAVIQRLTPDFLAAHRGGEDFDLPVMIVGMPRSGTTLVEQIVSSHDKVVGGGEMQFWPLRAPLFDKATDPASIAEFQRRTAADGIATLRSVAPDAARVVDKNPFNFLWAGVIHLVFPRAVIIHCRRAPIDTCLSAFSTYFRQRPDFSTDREDLVFYYRQYLRLMAHWRATLPPERFVEVDYEALVGDAERESRRLIDACGLEWQPQCLRPEDNRRAVRSASRWQARQPIYGAAVGRWRRYEPWIGSFRELEAEPRAETVP